MIIYDYARTHAPDPLPKPTKPKPKPKPTPTPKPKSKPKPDPSTSTRAHLQPVPRDGEELELGERFTQLGGDHRDLIGA